MKKQAGFTLVELLIVIALLSISIGITGDVLVSLVRSYNKTQVQNELEQATNFILQKMENELRNASNASVSGDSLAITQKDGTNIIYAANATNDTLTRQVGSQTAVSVLDTTGVSGTIDLSCNSQCFTVTQTNPKIVFIKISLSQNAGILSFDGSVPMENVVVLRNTY